MTCRPEFAAKLIAAERASAFEAVEKAAMTGDRWWTAAELFTTSDVGRPPETPITVNG